jgi:hypothetical protein
MDEDWLTMAGEGNGGAQMRMASMQQWMMRPIDSRVHATDPKLLSPESASSYTHA